MNSSTGTTARPWGRGRRRPRNVVIASLATISLAACSSGAVDQPTTAGSGQPSMSATGSPPGGSSPEATPTGEARTGTVFFGGAMPGVPAKLTMPAGWEASDVFVLRSDADPAFGLAFFDVANIYADGCRWELAEPPVGPSVDDLVKAWSSVPGAGGAARDVTVDGYRGKQIEYTVPDYIKDDCVEGKFAIVKEELSGEGNAPSLWAQTPGQQNQIRILDVDDTRLVVIAGFPPNISASDRSDLDTMISSLEIG